MLEEESDEGVTGSAGIDLEKNPKATTSVEKFIALGKSMDLTGSELQSFVKEQQAVERKREAEEKKREAEEKKREADERKHERETARKIEEAKIAADKEEREAERQFQLEMKRLDNEAKRHEVKEVTIDDGETANRRPPKLDVPKFENQFLSNITKYLDLFENVVKQNGYEESMWPLALRTAVVGTKLENIVALGGAYQDLKNEILIAFGQRPEEIWNELINAEQAEESFRQFCVRIGLKFGQFLDMSCDERTTKKMIEILVKYMVLRGCSEPLKVHFLERNIKSLSMDEFQEVGVAFQSAHGRINSTNVTMRQYHRQPQEATMQAWRVSVEETLSKLEKMMSVERRRSYVLENRLCFACLKKGHRAWDCHTKNSCGKCGGRHHSLLHAQSAPMEFEKTNVSMISSFSEPTKPADVLLMTAALDVVGRDGKKHAVRAFLDPGAQASFVSEELVKVAAFPEIEQTRLSVQGFGTPPELVQTAIHQVEIVDCFGSHHKIKALRREVKCEHKSCPNGNCTKVAKQRNRSF